MTYIVSYRKSITRDTTKQLNGPEGSTELCTLDGLTYVSIPADAAIDYDQPEEVLGTMEIVELDDEMRERICAESTHIALIRDRVRDKIAKLYSVHDEIKLIRTAPSHEFDVYNEHVEACRAWGREQKALLGL